MQVLRDRHQAVFLRLPEMLREKIPPVPGKGRLMPQVQELPAPEVPGGLTEEPVYIRNAGLVLLHPFLQYLFENVGYTVKNKWDSQALHQRSVVLTQYLVRGDDEYSEPDLFLNKLLAGFPVEAPLPLDITLSEYEKKEAEELLGSVIMHWKALKNTSAQALRETFIQRTGRIIRQDSGWLLTVDQKTQDILLGKLPWGFSLTKTSWMEEIITVDWT